MAKKSYPQDIGDLQMDADDQPSLRDEMGFAAEMNPSAEAAGAADDSSFKPGSSSTFQGSRNKGTSMKNQFKQKAGEMKREVKQKAGEVAEGITHRGQSLFVEQKDRVAGELEHFAAVMRNSAEKLREEGDPAIAGYANDLAGYVERASYALLEKNPGELLESGRSLVRRRPEVFLGALFFAGLGVARFMKASEPSSNFDSEYEADVTPESFASTCP